MEDRDKPRSAQPLSILERARGSRTARAHDVPIVTSWPRPLPGFLLEEDGEVTCVHLVTAVFHPDSEQGYYVGFRDNTIAILERWAGAWISFDEGTALRYRARSLRPNTALALAR